MKKIIFTNLLIILGALIFAQAPDKISYQAVVRNSSDQLVKNTNIGIQISILQVSVSGPAVYVERQFPKTNDNGLVSVEIGTGTVVSGVFSNIDWGSGEYFLKTETDLNGGSNYTITGTSQLLSVPYALYAKTAGNGFSGNYDDLTNTPSLFSGSFNDLSDKPSFFDGGWANLTGKPTTLIGYGITDAMSSSHSANAITSSNITNWNTAFSWGNHSGIYRPITYVPTWSEITNKPTTITGFGIIDAVTTNGNQTIAGNKTFTGTINASNKVITNVANPANSTDAANKAYVDAIKETIYNELLDAGMNGVVKDIEGNIYKTIKIGNQIWMAEDLAYLPTVSPPSSGSTTSPYYYVYGYEGTSPISAKATSNYSTYGVLYNWPAAMAGAATSNSNPSGVQGVCPSGWHLPSNAEWIELIDFLGGEDIAGGKLKEVGNDHWYSTNTDATDETGFTALPSGYRDNYYGAFYSMGYLNYWWSTDVSGTGDAGYFGSYYDNAKAFRGDYDKDVGFSVRCIKD